MTTLATSLAPLALGVLLALTGASKAFGRQLARRAAGTVLVRVLGDGRRAGMVLRATGFAELAIAAGLLAAPTTTAPAVAACALGGAFVGYLAYARITAPESSCGCTKRANAPITWRAFVRAGLVVAGGAASLPASTSWWHELGRHPLPAVGALLLAAAVLVTVSSDLDHLWLVPLRRTRLRIFGHPLIGYGGYVPVAASVELLERSQAWVTAHPIVRSALIDHWDADGWRFLQFAGVRETGDDARPVTVLFALDPRDTRDTAPNPAIRVSVIDDIDNQPVALDPLTAG